MRLSPVLTFYLGWHYLVNFGIVMGVLLGLGFTADVLELMRRAAGRPDLTFDMVTVMAILKLPDLGQRLLPFALLVGAMLTLQKLTRTQELAVARSAGVSVWQFLFPGLALAFLLGASVVTVYNPLASVLISKYEDLESKYLKGKTSLLAISGNGLWLRDADAEGQIVVHALRVAHQGVELNDAILLFYEGTDNFSRRIDARVARLQTGFWDLQDALISYPDRAAVFEPRYRVPTSLTLSRIQDSFASPETLSFWSLPGFIDTLEAAGFSAVRHRMHFNKILATPFFLAGLMLVAAPFALRLARRGGTGLLLTGGVIAGFLVFFFSDIVYALGDSGEIPILLAAWSPPAIAASSGLAMLFYLEEG